MLCSPSAEKREGALLITQKDRQRRETVVVERDRGGPGRLWQWRQKPCQSIGGHAIPPLPLLCFPSLRLIMQCTTVNQPNERGTEQTAGTPPEQLEHPLSTTLSFSFGKWTLTGRGKKERENGVSSSAIQYVIGGRESCFLFSGE